MGALHAGVGCEAEAAAVNGHASESPKSLWAGRFTKEPAPEALVLGRSLDFDIELLDADIWASQAHVRALADAGLLTEEEAAALDEALEAVPDRLAELTEDDVADIEDVHLLVEWMVTEQLGELGAKLHAGRSRNDLVVADFRLWMLGACAEIQSQSGALAGALASRAREGVEWVMPGLTHNRPAQVVTLGYYLAAHSFALLRDIERLDDWAERAAVSPLGAGAMATSTLGLDPEATAERLGMTAAFDNALDAVGDRDFAIEFISCLSILAMHVSRLAADLARWSEPAIGFARLDDAYSTGSSMMPQKRNPDVLELARGKASRVLGDLAGLSALPIGLPLGYHRDLQEDKEPVLDAAYAVTTTIPAVIGCLETATFDPEKMRASAADEDLFATDLAEALVRSGVAFRDAHRRTGELLRDLAEDGRALHDMTADEWKAYGLPEGAAMLDPDASVRARSTRGGPAPEQVRAQADLIDARLASRE